MVQDPSNAAWAQEQVPKQLWEQVLEPEPGQLSLQASWWSRGWLPPWSGCHSETFLRSPDLQLLLEAALHCCHWKAACSAAYW
mmetsp:Transcript_104249/g.304330  ORF Transcript_104249/g.304330 Transcript_104249/m.304330 type:complete len:83 (+) Transcript_104249:612-860(+)